MAGLSLKKLMKVDLPTPVSPITAMTILSGLRRNTTVSFSFGHSPWMTQCILKRGSPYVEEFVYNLG